MDRDEDFEGFRARLSRELSHVPPAHSGYGMKNSGEAGKPVRRFHVQIRVMMLGLEWRQHRQRGRGICPRSYI